MILKSTNEWENDLSKLEFKVMDAFREYMSVDEDANDDTSAADHVSTLVFPGLAVFSFFFCDSLHFNTLTLHN